MVVTHMELENQNIVPFAFLFQPSQYFRFIIPFVGDIKNKYQSRALLHNFTIIFFFHAVDFNKVSRDHRKVRAPRDLARVDIWDRGLGQDIARFDNVRERMNIRVDLELVDPLCLVEDKVGGKEHIVRELVSLRTKPVVGNVKGKAAES